VLACRGRHGADAACFRQRKVLGDGVAALVDDNIGQDLCSAVGGLLIHGVALATNNKPQGFSLALGGFVDSW